MPCHTWHENKKLHNFDAFRFLGNAKAHTFIDWEVVTLFYSALNYVDSFLARAHGIDVVYDHQDRLNLVHSFLTLIERDYRLLYHLSTDSRYNDVPIGTRELNKAKSYYRNLEVRLTSVLCGCGHLNLINKGNCENCGRPL